MSLSIPEEAGVVIDQRFKTRGVEVLFAHQIDQHTRIEIAAARSHDHPTDTVLNAATVPRPRIMTGMSAVLTVSVTTGTALV
jgi:hypothetical protein